MAPFTAFADAYFCRSRTSIWLASRGLGGKSLLVALLAFMEAIFLSASITVIGGSGEQAERVHKYMAGKKSSNLPGTFWEWPHAPKYLLATDTTKRVTELSHGGSIEVLMASQKSVRGPHPQRLRCDEVDEMEKQLLETSMGQPMESRDIEVQIVLSSTRQYANGTFQDVLERAKTNDWQVYEWCYRENAEPNGWLLNRTIEGKKSDVTAETWEAEFENQLPNPGTTAFVPDRVEAMFRRDLGVYPGDEQFIVVERPEPGARYCTGADWAKKTHKTIICTFRTDVKPVRLVAYRCISRIKWPAITGMFDDQVIMYPGPAAHDATGLGTVVTDLLQVQAVGLVLQGERRKALLQNYIVAVEHDKIIAPYITRMFNEHRNASHADVFDPSGEHLPDSICAGAICWSMISSGIWVQGMAG